MQRSVETCTGERVALAVIENLIRKGVKLLALDFDLTIIDFHTGGAWRGPTHQLAQHVRPCFKALIEAALETADIHLCVVTYSLQRGVIEDLLHCVLPNSDTGRILVCTSCKDWLPKNNQPSQQNLGKQQHIAQVTTDLYNLRRAVIHPHEILLMDDDEENINTARHFGHLAFWVKEGVTLEDINTFVEKMKECHATHSVPYSSLHDPCCPVIYDSKYRATVTGQQVPPQKREYSAQVYLMPSQNKVHNQRQEMVVSEMSYATGFTIPRPLVTHGLEEKFAK